MWNSSLHYWPHRPILVFLKGVGRWLQRGKTRKKILWWYNFCILIVVGATRFYMLAKLNSTVQKNRRKERKGGVCCKCNKLKNKQNFEKWLIFAQSVCVCVEGKRRERDISLKDRSCVNGWEAWTFPQRKPLTEQSFNKHL